MVALYKTITQTHTYKQNTQ